ncbi:MAG: hypothetical protein ACXVLQ_00220 [Bacteriovorax sp.]
MTKVQPKLKEPVKNDNLKNLMPMKGKVAPGPHGPQPTPSSEESSTISETAKLLNAPSAEGGQPPIKQEEATSTATSIAKTLAKVPVLPIVPKENRDSKKLEEKLEDNPSGKMTFIKRPAVIFIEGFSAFGISDGDGIKDMAENCPGAKRFSWDEQDKIIDEIKRHSPDQPVILVGHSFGGDSAVEIANSLNTLKNGFRGIDLLVSIDSVGMNHSIIPMNVKRNLNFFGEGVVPFLHGDPTVARNTDHTEVINELRSELHSRMDDSEEVQFKIFSSINEVLGEHDHQNIFEEMQKKDLLKGLIDSRLQHSKL